LNSLRHCWCDCRNCGSHHTIHIRSCRDGLRWCRRWCWFVHCFICPPMFIPRLVPAVSTRAPLATTIASASITTTSTSAATTTTAGANAITAIATAARTPTTAASTKSTPTNTRRWWMLSLTTIPCTSFITVLFARFHNLMLRFTGLRTRFGPFNFHLQSLIHRGRMFHCHLPGLATGTTRCRRHPRVVTVGGGGPGPHPPALLVRFLYISIQVYNKVAYPNVPFVIIVLEVGSCRFRLRRRRRRPGVCHLRSVAAVQRAVSHWGSHPQSRVRGEPWCEG